MALGQGRCRAAVAGAYVGKQQQCGGGGYRRSATTCGRTGSRMTRGLVAGSDIPVVDRDDGVWKWPVVGREQCGPVVVLFVQLDMTVVQLKTILHGDD